ncbi:MAG TPA: PA2779 family protein [Methylomirabilota bacterium]|nr:PA2779 family protein [Methylomirabilota bacterium]
MLRTRVLCPRWLTVALVLWVAAWLTLPAPAEGAPLPPTRSQALDASVDERAELAALQRMLVAQGLTPSDAAIVLERLTPAERAELALRIDELAAGGDAGVWIIVVLIVVAILLYLPMAGRMQGWW